MSLCLRVCVYFSLSQTLCPKTREGKKKKERGGGENKKERVSVAILVCLRSSRDDDARQENDVSDGDLQFFLIPR